MHLLASNIRMQIKNTGITQKKKKIYQDKDQQGRQHSLKKTKQSLMGMIVDIFNLFKVVIKQR